MNNVMERKAHGLLGHDYVSQVVQRNYQLFHKGGHPEFKYFTWYCYVEASAFVVRTVLTYRLNAFHCASRPHCPNAVKTDFMRLFVSKPARCQVCFKSFTLDRDDDVTGDVTQIYARLRRTVDIGVGLLNYGHQPIKYFECSEENGQVSGKEVPFEVFWQNVLRCLLLAFSPRGHNVFTREKEKTTFRIVGQGWLNIVNSSQRPDPSLPLDLHVLSDLPITQPDFHFNYDVGGGVYVTFHPWVLSLA